MQDDVGVVSEIVTIAPVTGITADHGIINDLNTMNWEGISQEITKIPSSLLKVADALAMGTVTKTQNPKDWLDENIKIICEIANGPYPDLGVHHTRIRNSLFPVSSSYFH